MKIIDLSFPQFPYGERENVLDLTQLLYIGASGLDIGKVKASIKSGLMKADYENRLELVSRIHEVLSGAAAGGTSKRTIRSRITIIRQIFSWAERNSYEISISSMPDIYQSWSDHLLHRVKIEKSLAAFSASNTACIASSILEEALDLSFNPYRKSRLSATRSREKRWSPKNTRLRLDELFRFGSTLSDICDGITYESATGKLPVQLALKSGKKIDLWGGCPATDLGVLLTRAEAQQKGNQYTSRQNALINLRLMAEMHIFISQTSINLADCIALSTKKVAYKSYGDGYLVSGIHKKRKGGEVRFEIYSAYRVHFDRYLRFRASINTTDSNDLLFPFHISFGRDTTTPPTCASLKRLCKRLDTPYFSPAHLRKARVNWLLRLSADVELTAEMAQHTKETLFRHYELPNHQAALVQISEFFSSSEIEMKNPSSGGCAKSSPEQFIEAPDYVPKPDCVSPSGCLTCINHRDIRSFDYIWSLLSYRQLKLIEASIQYQQFSKSMETAADIIISIVSDKIAAFRTLDAEAKNWTHEAEARIEEEHFHPMWEGFIKTAEISNAIY